MNRKEITEELERIERFCGTKPNKLIVNPERYVERYSEINMYAEHGLKVEVDRGCSSDHFLLAVG